MKHIRDLHKVVGLSGTAYYLYIAAKHQPPQQAGVLVLLSHAGSLVSEVPDLSQAVVAVPGVLVLFVDLDEEAERQRWVQDLRAGLAAHPLQIA